jgi:hypothetical protein
MFNMKQFSPTTAHLMQPTNMCVTCNNAGFPWGGGDLPPARDVEKICGWEYFTDNYCLLLWFYKSTLLLFEGQFPYIILFTFRYLSIIHTHQSLPAYSTQMFTEIYEIRKIVSFIILY